MVELSVNPTSRFLTQQSEAKTQQNDHSIEEGNSHDNFINKMMVPFEEEQMIFVNKQQSSNFQSYINTVKLYFGNAYISLPNTFMYSGWLGGMILILTVGVINCYTMLLNIYVAERYPEISSYSLLAKKIYGKNGKLIVDISIWIM